jgi:hypothetical protein
MLHLYLSQLYTMPRAVYRAVLSIILLVTLVATAQWLPDNHTSSSSKAGSTAAAELGVSSAQEPRQAQQSAACIPPSKINVLASSASRRCSLVYVGPRHQLQPLLRVLQIASCVAQQAWLAACRDDAATSFLTS